MDRRIYLIFAIFIASSTAKLQGIENVKFLSETFPKPAYNPCESSDETFVSNPRGCSWFFTCNESREIIYEGRCDGQLRFNYEMQQCDHPENVPDCVNPKSPEKCPGTAEVTRIPHPSVCSKYTVCFEGIMNDRECPFGYHFSYYDGDCVEQRFADCDTDAALCSESIAAGLPQFVENPRDCSVYFLCVNSKALILRCAPGQQFDLAHGWCDSEDVVGCESTTPDDDPNIPDITSIDCDGNSGITLPHPDPKYCQFYFFCAADRSYLQICGKGLSYDIITGRCQLSEDATCVLVPPVPTILPDTTTTEKVE